MPSANEPQPDDTLTIRPYPPAIMFGASGRMSCSGPVRCTAIESAIRGGVRRVHVISYDARDSVLAEVFTNEGTGTMIVADVKALTPAEQHPEGAAHP